MFHVFGLEDYLMYDLRFKQAIMQDRVILLKCYSILLQKDVTNKFVYFVWIWKEALFQKIKPFFSIALMKQITVIYQPLRQHQTISKVTNSLFYCEPSDPDPPFHELNRVCFYPSLQILKCVCYLKRSDSPHRWNSNLTHTSK